MSATAASTFVETLCSLPLLSVAQRDELTQKLLRRFPDAQALGRELVQRGWLTAFQVKRLLAGHGSDLLFGAYVLLDQLGEGGVGRVFKARHVHMQRLVALKMIRPDLLADADTVNRFHREVAIISQLNHPNIVHALDVTPLGNTVVLVMEYVEGTDLLELVQKSGPLTAALACEYVRQAALGLQHIHERGLVHRDIKPSNLLLSMVRGPSSVAGKQAGLRPKDSSSTDQGQRTTDHGLIKILDLGLARLQESKAVQGSLTLSGSVMLGTVDYMAPEQALDSRSVDIRADIYSLGCTLFYLLTGKPPFPDGSKPEKLMQHQLREPPPLEQLRTDLPAELRAIVRRMLAKAPRDRFQTPAELAAALQPLVPARAVAPPPTAVTKAPATIVTPAAARKTRRTPLLKWSFLKSLKVRLALVGCLLLLVLAGAAWMLFRSATTETSPAPEGGVPSRQLASFEPLDANRIPADERFDWQPKELVAVLGEHRFRHWHSVTCLAISPDGRRVATATLDHVVHLWDTAAGKELAAYRGHSSTVNALAFAADGQVIASASSDKTVRLWDINTGKPRTVLKEHPEAVVSVAIAPDSSALAGGMSDGSIRVWDLGAAKERATLKGTHAKAVTFVAFVRNSAILESAADDGTAVVWNVGAQKAALTLKGGESLHPPILFTTDGQFLVSRGRDGSTIQAWDMLKAAPLHSWKTGESRITAMAVAPDSRTLATAAPVSALQPCPIKLWDPVTGKERAVLRGHSVQVRGMAFAGDSRTLVSTAGRDNLVRLWDTSTVQELAVSKQRYDVVYPFVAFGPDGRGLCAARVDDRIVLLDLVSGQERATFACRHRGTVAPGFGPDGQLLAWFRNGETVILWDAATAQERGSVKLPQVHYSTNLALSPDGKTLAGAIGDDHLVRLWDVGSGRERALLRGHTVATPRLTFAPDGKTLASVTDDNVVKLWDVASGQERATWTGFPSRSHIAHVAVTSDGKRLAAVYGTGQVMLWDTALAKELHLISMPAVSRVMFAPDGRHLVLGNSNGTVYVLRLAESYGKPAAKLLGSP